MNRKNVIQNIGYMYAALKLLDAGWEIKPDSKTVTNDMIISKKGKEFKVNVRSLSKRLAVRYNYSRNIDFIIVVYDIETTHPRFSIIKNDESVKDIIGIGDDNSEWIHQEEYMRLEDKWHLIR